MSLINDALRRASQAERNRSRAAPAPLAIEPAPAAANGSKLSMLLVATVLLSLLLACWFFWQWWMVRHNWRTASTVNNSRPIVASAPVAPPPAFAATPRPSPAPVAVAAPAAARTASPVAPARPAPPPVAAAAAVPAGPPPWPVDLKLSAIFFSKTNPRALINGQIYGTGDNVHGVVIREIDRIQVVVQWNDHTRELMLSQP